MTTAVLRVVRPGLLATVQDLGRPGLAHLGVPHSGAADPASLRLANRLVGNAEDAAGIETTLLGADLELTVRPDRPAPAAPPAPAGRWMAVTGARCAVRVGGRPADTDRPQFVPAGSTLSIGAAESGVRSYLAVAGGIVLPPVLGSRATDLLSGIGPARLSAGDLLPLGRPAAAPAAVDVVPLPAPPEVARVRLLPGPRQDWFTAESLATLATATYRVSPVSDRIGVRLEGPALARSVPAELPSEGVVLGAVQVPADGVPLVFLADHPTTGGYPVVGVVHPADLAVVAQAAPGTRLRFTMGQAATGAATS